MYTLEELKQKSLKELKDIGWQLNVLPEGDRRCRQSWIDALVGVTPPLLKLLEDSPAASVDQVQDAIEQAAKKSLDVDRVQEPPLESKFGRIVYPRPAQESIAQAAKTCPGVEVDPVSEAIVPVAETCPGVEVDPVSEPIAQAAETCPGVEVDRDQEPIMETAKTSPGVEVDRAQEPIMETVETSPGVDLYDELPECSNCFGDGYVEDEFGFVKFCHCETGETEPILSHQRTQRAITPAAKISLNSEPDLNPILTGVCLSDRFLTRYSPPQSAIRYKADAYGQLNLFDFETASSDEPPDPDDFESLDAFREAIARWDAQNPEPPAVSIDSMCEWAPCPEEWYEPEAEIWPLKASSMIELPKQSEVMELSITAGSSITSDFVIPTFDAWRDRPNRRDEPPDTGIFANLPKPKPPKFPPQAAANWRQVEYKLDTTGQPKSVQVSPSRPKSAQVNSASRNYPATIPKLFHRIAAGTSTQPARSPPGGDARRGQSK
jgi:hypothetical protein